jgi:hypothetical protein
VANEKDPLTKEVDTICESLEAENRLRKAIAEITAKLIRSNLSAVDGKRYAKSLVTAFETLEKFESRAKGKPGKRPRPKGKGAGQRGQSK